MSKSILGRIVKNSIGLSLLALVAQSHAATINIIPKPNKVQELKGEAFPLTKRTAIRYDKRLIGEAKLLAASIEKATGLKPRLVEERLRILLHSEIYLDLADNKGAKESYSLKVSSRRVRINGADKAGAFYGAQSLLQLIPLEGEAELPACSIEDQPRFGWRGMHLDVGRHFFKVKNIKQFIDQLAVHKMNMLHWHLTEDQGWRIEIKKYPKLTSVGAFRKATPPYGSRWKQDDTPYGGFYTQEEIKDIVAYAKARHVTIMPEIEVPGHAAAAIAAYPEFGNTDVPNYKPEVKTYWGVHPYTFAPKEETFAFLEDVFTEVCELFDSKYIHIGGDEAPKNQWKQSKFAQSVIKKHGLHGEHGLQSYFIKRVEKILESKGRKLIGWDEIREGGLSPNATMMLWRGWGHAIKSVNEGHDVVMAPSSHTYFDHYQNKAAIELIKGKEFECIGGFRPLKSVYSFNPIPKQFRGTAKAKQILGCQAQLWSEYMKTWDKVEYCAFPRIAALAEVAWTETKQKEYNEFLERLEVMAVRYKRAGINAFDQSTFFEIKPLKGMKISSNLQNHGQHIITSIVDGNPASFFWSNTELNKGDHITISFDKAKSGKTLVVKTGDASTYADQLRHGVLQASADGKSWSKLAKFKKGTAQAKLPRGTKYVRILCSKGQGDWLQVQDVDLR